MAIICLNSQQISLLGMWLQAYQEITHIGSFSFKSGLYIAGDLQQGPMGKKPAERYLQVSLQFHTRHIYIFTYMHTQTTNQSVFLSISVYNSLLSPLLELFSCLYLRPHVYNNDTMLVLMYCNFTTTKVSSIVLICLFIPSTPPPSVWQSQFSNSRPEDYHFLLVFISMFCFSLHLDE